MGKASTIVARSLTAEEYTAARRLLVGGLWRDELDTRLDEMVMERLTEVKGLGRWTAEMFLMFRLHRPDVLPVDDLGIVKAVQRLYRLRKRPNAAKLQRLGEG